MKEIDFRIRCDEEYIEHLREIADRQKVSVNDLVMSALEKEYPMNKIRLIDVLFYHRRIIAICAAVVLLLVIGIPVGIFLGKHNAKEQPQEPALEVEILENTVEAENLCLVHDLDITLTYGEGYGFNGKWQKDTEAAYSTFIPVSRLGTTFQGANIAYSVYDMYQNYLRGHWDISTLTLDPAQGDSYVVFVFTCGSVETASCCYTTPERTLSTEFKTFEILGDASSAHAQSILQGNSAYYGRSDVETDVTDASQMWYSLFEEYTGWELTRNDSWSGSCISKISSEENSFVARAEKRFMEAQHSENPDVLFIFGGQGDFSAKAELGEAMYSHWTEEDLTKVLPAACYLFDLVGKKAPDTQIVFVMSWVNDAAYMSAMEEVCAHYGVTYVDFCQRSVSRAGAYPTAEGMKAVAGQITHTLIQKGIL